MFDDAASGLYSVSAECVRDGPYSRACQNAGEWQAETSGAVYCLDGEHSRPSSKEEMREYWSLVREQSRLLGDIWAEYRMMCIGWDVQPRWRFSGVPRRYRCC